MMVPNQKADMRFRKKSYLEKEYSRKGQKK